MLCLVPMSFLVSCAGFVLVLCYSGRSAECLRGGAYCTSALCPYCPFEWMDQVVDARFSSCRYVDCVVSSERQCLCDSRCDISGIDEVPCLIAIATDGMDDCRNMMPGKGQAEHSTMPAMNQSLPVRLMRNLAAEALVYIRYMVVILCAYISFRYLR